MLTHLLRLFLLFYLMYLNPDVSESRQTRRIPAIPAIPDLFSYPVGSHTVSNLFPAVIKPAPERGHCRILIITRADKMTLETDSLIGFC